MAGTGVALRAPLLLSLLLLRVIIATDGGVEGGVEEEEEEEEEEERRSRLNLSRCGNRPCCECSPAFGKCTAGVGEDSRNGCGNTGLSCADLCRGDYPWKVLYRDTVRREAALFDSCRDDPTKDWGAAPAAVRAAALAAAGGPSGQNDRPPQKFAIAFSGGMRNFVAVWHSWLKNVVEPSGGLENVHIFFHVWGDENTQANFPIAKQSRALAKELTQKHGAYREERFADHLQLLIAEEPGFGDGNGSWLGAVEDEMKRRDASARAEGRGRDSMRRPFVTGPGYSQWRKVFLCAELVREASERLGGSDAGAHGNYYDLIVRARPDHLFLAPMDLRDLVSNLGARAPSLGSRGHFLAMPERYQGQTFTDHAMMGTPAAMLAYAAKPLPFTGACCEGYVQRNLYLRCVHRDAAIVETEFVASGGVSGARRVDDFRANAGDQKLGMNTDGGGHGWSLVPREVRASDYSSLINNPHTAMTFGYEGCRRDPSRQEQGSGCIPFYRVRFSYIYNIVTTAWFDKGAVCIGRYAGDEEAEFLVRSGLANETLPDVAVKHRFGPCLRIPTLAKAHDAASAYIKDLPDEVMRTSLLSPRRRRSRQRRRTLLLLLSKEFRTNMDG